MARRRRTETAVSKPESVEGTVRAAARAISTRLDTRTPSVETLVLDDAFVSASDLLVATDVPFDTVARLGRASSPILAAMAHRAAASREDVTSVWVEWAYRRLTRVYAGEVVFLLEAIERHGEPPFIARVLARGDSDWDDGWLLEVVTDFVARRVRAGERPAAGEFELFVKPQDEDTVADVVAALEGTLPEESLDEFREWRGRRERTRFFASVGRIWEPPSAPPALTTVGGRAAVAAALETALRPPQPRSVLLVGEHGVGKSAVARDILRQLHREGWLVFEASAQEIHAGARYSGEIETRISEMAKHAGGHRVVWLLPTFENALWEGQHSRSPRGLLDTLFPFVEAGELVIVGEIEPLAYELLVQQRPRIVSLFEALALEPLGREESITVARDWRDRAHAAVDDATIDDAQDLAQHYLASVAAPAGLLRLLKAAATGVGDEEIRSGRMIETLSDTTGLPLHVVDPERSLDLEEVRQFFSSRVLNQPEAVECLVERIALIKANLTDPTRPLGVFLFVGPTGTGKTEIAKTLAEYLFGSEERLVRLDMSEFQTADSFGRLLVDSTLDRDAAPLISSVRAKPFSVVLFDEFEKAHRRIWNVFLQLFDDGRLTDTRGRTVSFRQCIVILTSNLGAAVESGRHLGFTDGGGPTFRPAAVEREVSRVFRPELINRIDRIVVFRPFERGQMRALVERELDQVLMRRGFRTRPWAVEWDDAALEFLAEKGFSPELGARPLKRAVERYLLAPLAAAIASHSFPEGEQFLFVTAQPDGIEVTFVDPNATVDETAFRADEGSLRLERLVLDPHGGPEESAYLQSETERLQEVIDGDAWSGAKERDLAEMRNDSFWDSPERFDVLARIELVDRVQAAFRTAQRLSNRLTRLRADNGHASAREVVKLLAERLYLLDRACSNAGASDPADAFVEVRAIGVDRAEEAFAVKLVEMYEAWGRRRGMRVRRLWSDVSPTRVLAVSGIGAYQILATESGLHVYESPRDERTFDRVAVQVVVAPCSPSSPETEPAEAARRALAESTAPKTIVRRYRADPSPLVRDSVRGRTGRLDRVLAGDFDVIVGDD